MPPEQVGKRRYSCYWNYQANSSTYRKSITNTHAFTSIEYPFALPFSNKSTERNQEIFSDGQSEALLNKLAKMNCLQVTSRTSSIMIQEHKFRATQIGKI